MNRSLQIKWAMILVATAWALYSLWPTFRLASSGEELPEETRTELEDRAIKRGLDLAGGMYLVLEVDTADLEEGADEEEALDRVIEILRNRVDQFGVSEPVIQKEGNKRIVVQLPGLQDAERAKRLIGQTARLEFQLVREGAEVRNLLQRLDRVLAGTTDGAVDTTAASDGEAGGDSEVARADSAAADSAAVDDLFADTAPEAVDTEAGIDPERPIGSRMRGFNPNIGAIMVDASQKPRLRELLASDRARRIMPRDVEFLWGDEPLRFEGYPEPVHLLYLVGTDVVLAGEHIQNAVTTADPDRPAGGLMISLTLTRRGGLLFANVTGNNVGQKLAIVLDEIVQTAPVIQNKITGGRASITGSFTVEEARDTALMLRAGALPADVVIAEERTVGPSLGQESIDKGVKSAMWGGIIVIVFVIIYYKLAGLLAATGLALTLLLLLGILAQLHLTLTLPGIAGIILTVGMAVDANVLIFERIREELRAGKTVRGAIDAGYAQATRAIVDANITTFIAAVVLFYFGTGPIKGFAVTLSIGIVTSMFSALVFTRAFYETWLGRNRNPSGLSI